MPRRSPKSNHSPGSGPAPRHVPLIGLIGPIGAGKSTVAGWLAERGAVVIDADQVTRELMAPGTPVTRAIVARFGERFRLADGSLDRAALGRLVFSDPAALTALEAIVHPATNELLERVIRKARQSKPPAVVLEAVKLVEAGQAASCDAVWLITCDPATQLARLVGRGVDESDARQRIVAQESSLPLWRSAATRVIRSDGSLDESELAADAAFSDALARHSGAE